MTQNPENTEQAREEGHTFPQLKRLYEALGATEIGHLLSERIHILNDQQRKKALQGVDAAADVAVYFPLSIRKGIQKKMVPLISEERRITREVSFFNVAVQDGWRIFGAFSQAKGERAMITGFGVNEQNDVKIIVNQLSGDLPAESAPGEDFDFPEIDDAAGFEIQLTDAYEINKVSGRIHEFLNALETYNI